MPVATSQQTTSSRPEILLFIPMNIFLKKLIIEPIITTGCIFPGSSPKMTSIASENINANMTNANNLNETISLTFGVLYCRSIPPLLHVIEMYNNPFVSNFKTR